MAARFEPANLQPLPNEEQLYCNSCHQFTAEAQFVSQDSASGIAHPRLAPVLRLPRDAAAAWRPSIRPRIRTGQLRDVPQPAHRREAHGRAQVLRRRGLSRRLAGVAFHVGRGAPQGGASSCQTCHVPHAARVDASDCTGCHESVRKGGASSAHRSRSIRPRRCSRASRLIEPRPLERCIAWSSRAARGARHLPGEPPGADRRPALPLTPSPINAIADSPASPATRTSSPTRNAHVRAAPRLPDLPPPAAGLERMRDLPSGVRAVRARPVTVEVSVPRQLPRSRGVPFEHAKHADLACIEVPSRPA